MTVYLYMHPLENPGDRATLLRLNALRTLRDELAAMPALRVVATPRGADLEVEVVNVVASDDVGGMMTRDQAPRILVVRMNRRGERLDFVCSDGHGGLTAERQAARRIGHWMAGEDFMTASRRTSNTAVLRATA